MLNDKERKECLAAYIRAIAEALEVPPTEDQRTYLYALAIVVMQGRGFLPENDCGHRWRATS